MVEGLGAQMCSVCWSVRAQGREIADSLPFVKDIAKQLENEEEDNSYWGRLDYVGRGKKDVCCVGS